MWMGKVLSLGVEIKMEKEENIFLPWNCSIFNMAIGNRIYQYISSVYKSWHYDSDNFACGFEHI